MGYHLSKPEDWWEILNNMGYRALQAQISAPQRNAFKQAHLAEVNKLTTEQGIWLDVETHFTTGRRPAI